MNEITMLPSHPTVAATSAAALPSPRDLCFKVTLSLPPSKHTHFVTTSAVSELLEESSLVECKV